MFHLYWHGTGRSDAFNHLVMFSLQYAGVRQMSIRKKTDVFILRQIPKRKRGVKPPVLRTGTELKVLLVQ